MLDIQARTSRRSEEHCSFYFCSWSLLHETTALS